MSCLPTTVFSTFECVPLPRHLQSNFGKTRADLTQVITHVTISPWSTSAVMVWLARLSRSQITTGQAPAATSLGATLSERAGQAIASRTHRHTLKTKRKLDLETMSSFSRLSGTSTYHRGYRFSHFWTTELLGLSA